MRRHILGIPAVALAALVLPGAAQAGHEVSFYPSFYPQEIRLEFKDEAQAAALFKKKALGAYLGGQPAFGASPPAHVKWVESLGSVVLVTVDPNSAKLKRADERCAALGRLTAALAKAPGLVLHPHPVTPFHADYLAHVDRVEAGKAALPAKADADPALAVRAEGALAQALAQAGWRVVGEAWDVRVDAVAAAALESSLGAGLWPPAPWSREGWHHAYKLLAGYGTDPAARARAEEAYGRLARGRFADASERAVLERRLLADLAAGCGRAVAGYTLRREAYDDDFSTGVENVGFDSLSGFASGVFARTVKLKDFPWNGWLTLGAKERAEAAWNPVAGFNDAVGRFLWSIAADPAFVAHPYGRGWLPNRVDGEPAAAVDRGRLGRVEVPADALAPQPGSGLFKPVGTGRAAAAKVSYRITASPFDDGSEVSMADLLYPYALAFRWGATGGDPDVAAATRPLRDGLVGVKPLTIERGVRVLADIKVPLAFPMLEVYVDHASPDPSEVAALAPPWGPVPWHLLLLMEEAVSRGFAAFSRGEAERRKVPWLDLVRDKALLARLKPLVEEFQRAGHRPPALADLVTAEEAKVRWQALGKFLAAHGHLLVANGPFRLREWSKEAVAFDVNRDLTYPVGIGTFDLHADPPKAILTALERKGNAVEARADVEMGIKRGRRLEAVREPLKPDTLRGTYRVFPEAAYILIGPDGSVADAGRARLHADGRFVVELPSPLGKGRYDFRIAITVDGNAAGGAIGALAVEAGGS